MNNFCFNGSKNNLKIKGGELMKIETKIIELFNLFPETKDNDNLLFAYYIQEFQEEFVESLTEEEIYLVRDFIINEKIATLFSSLRRSRQKLQETNENYRGLEWYSRQIKAEELKQFYANN